VEYSHRQILTPQLVTTVSFSHHCRSSKAEKAEGLSQTNTRKHTKKASKIHQNVSKVAEFRK